MNRYIPKLLTAGIKYFFNYLHFQEVLKGTIQIHNPGSESKFDAVVVSIEGLVNLQLSNKTVGLFEAFTNSVKVYFETKCFV